MNNHKRQLINIIIGSLFFAAGFLLTPEYNILGFSNLPGSLILLAVSLVILGGNVLLNAVKNIFRGQIFDENFLMSIAVIGAFIIGEYAEGAAVMLFYQVGELFQSYAVGQSRKSISALMNIRPDYANILKDGNIIKTDPEEVQPGDMIIIKAGEKIPLDATVTEGTTMIDTSALTGESMPRSVSPGDTVLSGCININGVITARVTKEFGDSTVNKILDLVENASSKKSKSENFITKFARYYTPAVVIAAILLAAVPPLLIPGADFSEWVYRALSFLVISCPCALVISIPLSFFGGIGGASKKGILVKGSNYLEALSQTEIVVFDKTGTLTKGIFEVQEIHPCGISENELLELTAYAENYSNHPISLSIKRAYNKTIDTSRISNTEEISGHGVSALIDNKRVLAGNFKLMEKYNISFKENLSAGTAVHVSVDEKYAGYLIISDKVKDDAASAVKGLKAEGIKQTVMLTGDSRNTAEKIAGELGINTVYWELLPKDKVEKAETLLKNKSPKGNLAFVGDGINDAPVLARADVGIAMGGLGSDAAIEAADIVIMNDEPSKIITAIRIARRTLKIAGQNIFFALAVKFLILILGALGGVTMWTAVFADVGVSVIAILNAIRVLDVRNIE